LKQTLLNKFSSFERLHIYMHKKRNEKLNANTIPNYNFNYNFIFNEKKIGLSVVII